jgi:hypothetical protein
MLRRTLFVLTGLVAVAMFIVGGCSSDDVTNNGPLIGDPNSPQFQALRAAISTAVDSTLEEVFTFVDDPYRFPVDTINIRADLGIANPNDSVLYAYTNGWHVLYLGFATAANYQQTYVDSARFFDGGSLQRFPTTATDELDLIHHQESDYEGTEQTYQNVSLYVNINVASYNSQNQVIDGVGNVEVADMISGDETNYRFDVVIDEVGFAWEPNLGWEDIYPTSGSLQITATITDGDDVETWTINVDFSTDGSATVEAIYGDTTYEYNLTLFGN